MKITRIETLLIRAPDSSQVSGEGEFLVTPMHVFPDYRSVLGEGFVGLRGGPVGAVLVQVETDEGLTGLASTGVGNGAAAYIIEHCLQPIVVGPVRAGGPARHTMSEGPENRTRSAVTIIRA